MKGVPLESQAERHSGSPIHARILLKVIHYNQLSSDEGVFSAVVEEYGHEPVDEQALFHISLERLFHQLSDNENRFIRYKTKDGMSDASIRKRMRVTFTHLYEMKRNIRRHIELAFAA